MGKIFLIIGKSFAGKDTLANNILYNENFCIENNLERLVRYTTRKQRPNEVDGKDYYFISDDEFKKNFQKNDKVIVTSYNSKFGLLHYITDFSKLDNNKNYIITGDFESVEPYKKILGDKLCVIFLCPPNWALFQRFNSRDDNDEYADKKYKEIYRRFIDDLIKFGINSNEFLANCNILILLGKEYSLSSIKQFIEDFIKNDKNNTGVIISNNNRLTFNNTFFPVYLNFDYKNIMNGCIILHNGKIHIHTEDESFECVWKN